MDKRDFIHILFTDHPQQFAQLPRNRQTHKRATQPCTYQKKQQNISDPDNNCCEAVRQQVGAEWKSNCSIAEHKRSFSISDFDGEKKNLSFARESNQSGFPQAESVIHTFWRVIHKGGRIRRRGWLPSFPGCLPTGQGTHPVRQGGR